jgi:hypothetical protein
MPVLFNELPGHGFPGGVLPRASVVYEAASASRLWMGGAHARHGATVSGEDVRTGVVIDCAGDLPTTHRSSAGTWLACVFADLETHPSQMEHIARTARTVAARLREEVETNFYVFCQYGMNRSGLLTGLVLREMGMAPAEAVALIRLARPGALSNLTFLELIHRYQPGTGVGA